MSDVNRNIETVKRIYDAFGRGDVPSIMELIAEDVDWEHESHDHGVPWLVVGKGRQAVGRFFEALRNFQLEHWEVLSVMGEGDWVVGLVHIELTWKPTGKRCVERCEPHVWKFDAKGRVIAMRHAADTHHHMQVAGLAQ